MGQLVGIPVEEAVGQLKDYESSHVFKPFTNVKLDGDDILFYEFEKRVHAAPIVDNSFLRYFCDTAKIPFDYINSLDEKMIKELAHYHYPNIDQSDFTRNGKSTLVHDTKRDVANFAIVSSLRARISPSDILTNQAKKFEDMDSSRVAHLGMSPEGNVNFSLLNEKWNFSFLQEQALQDVSFFGITTSWDRNLFAPRVYGSSHRPRCANIMHSARNAGRINTNFKQHFSRFDVLKRFMEGTDRAIYYVNNKLVPQMQRTTEITFTDLIDLLDKFNLKGGDIREMVIQAFFKEEGKTLYHIIQACTYAATHLTEKPNEQSTLYKFVTNLLEGTENTETCQLCQQHILH